MLKLKLSILAIAAMITSHSIAQMEDTRDRISFGAKAGINFSNIYDSQSEDLAFESKLGFAGGVFVSLPLGKLLAIQPELHFSQKGYQTNGTFLGTNFGYTRTSNYVDLPILLAIRPASFISVVVGPQFAFQVSQKEKFTAGNFTNEQVQEFENDNLRKNKLGIHFGLDINLGHFVISPRYAMDLQDNKGDGTNTNPRYKNSYLQLALGFKF